MSMPNSVKNTPCQNRIGLFGGTFDPIHYGHINTANHIANWLSLKELSLIPCHIPPHKSSASATAQQREEMVQLVCNQQPLFTLDNRELTKTSTSYTVETLAQIKQEHPNSCLFFIIGMDSLLSFTTWHRWQEILKLAHIVVSTRPGYNLANSNQATKDLLTKHLADSLSAITNKSSGCILLSPENNHNISSSQIRCSLKEQLPVQNLLPENIYRYINRYKLYL